MIETKSYSGGCHCGAVRFQVSMVLSDVLSCNCSICGKSGSLLSFVPAAQFALQSGEGELASYLFNKHAIQHLFCSKCGIKSFARGTNPDGSAMVAVNARCLDDIDVASLSVTHFDGKSR